MVFHQLFTHHYGPAHQHPAKLAVRAYVEAISELGNHYAEEYVAGRAEVIDVLTAEEANLLHARRLARAHGWWPQEGLRMLYDHTGRTVEWRRLVTRWSLTWSTGHRRAAARPRGRMEPAHPLSG